MSPGAVHPALEALPRGSLSIGQRPMPDGKTVAFLLELGRAVRIGRHKRFMTQAALAERCGIERTYLGAIERGTRNPTLLVLRKIALALEVEVVDLVPVNDPPLTPARKPPRR